MLAAVAAVCVASAPVELSYDLGADVPVTFALSFWWLTSEYVLKDSLAPAQCHWCAHDALDDAARGLRAPLGRQRDAVVASDVIGVILTPLTVLGTSAALSHFGGATLRQGLVDALLIIEAMVASQAMNQVLKFIVARERPFVSALPPDEKPHTTQPADNNLSFFSGHSSYTFSLVAAGATIARARGYEKWWLILAAGLPLAATTAVLRVVSDKHYLTDVLAGSAFGLLVGWSVPALFHRPVQVGPVSAMVTPAPGGLGVAGLW